MNGETGFDLEGFPARLSTLIGDNSDRSFARLTGIGVTSLQNYKRGQIPGIDKAAMIARAAGVSLEWLITGEGQMNQGGEVARHVRLASSAQVPTDFTLVPRLDVEASAGAGALAPHEETVDYLAFQASWLSRKGINANFARVLTARGDSMEPSIRDGDVLLVDTSIDRVIDHAIYVVVYSGMVLVKRVQLMLDGSLVLRSDNKNYSEQTVDAQDVSLLHIAGRVMWFGRSI